jgi:hypothetical protein
VRGAQLRLQAQLRQRWSASLRNLFDHPGRRDYIEGFMRIQTVKRQKGYGIIS